MLVACPACKGNSTSAYVCTACGAPLPPPSHPHVAAPHVTTSHAAPIVHRVFSDEDSPGTHGLSPADILELQNLDRARIRRRQFQEFAMALTVLVVVIVGSWILFFARSHQKASTHFENLPPEIAAVLEKRQKGVSEIITFAVAFNKLGEDADAGILGAGIAKAAVAANYKERWTSLEGARISVLRSVRVQDRTLMDQLGTASAQLGSYLDSFAGWKPDEKAEKLRLAQAGFEKIMRTPDAAESHR
jgi:hypothetical protein